MEAGGVPCIEAGIGLFEGKAPVKIFEKQNIGTERGYAGLQKVQTDRIGRKYFPGERVSIVLEAVSGELFIFGGKKLFSRIDGSTRGEEWKKAGQAAAVVVMPVAQNNGVQLGKIDTQFFCIVSEGACLAGVEEQPFSRKFDKERKAVLEGKTPVLSWLIFDQSSDFQFHEKILLLRSGAVFFLSIAQEKAGRTVEFLKTLDTDSSLMRRHIRKRSLPDAAGERKAYPYAAGERKAYLYAAG